MEFNLLNLLNNKILFGMSTEQTTQEQVKYDNDPAVAAFMDSTEFSSEEQVQSTETKTGEEPVITPDAPANEEGGNPEPAKGEEPEKPAGETKTDFDINKYFEQSSEGLIKSEDDFKSALTKAKEYEALQKQIEDLKAEKEGIFANETIKTQNRLIKEGKSEEQVAEFLKLSKMDIATLDAKEVLIQREIKNGHTRSTAEKLVAREYSLDKLSFDEDILTADELAKNKEELELIEAKMKNDARPVREEMQKEFESLKTEISPTEKALQEVAAKKAYREKLVPFAEKLQSDFPKKLVIGDDSTGVLSYDVPKEVIDSIKSDAVDYFENTEVNAQNVEDFITVKKATWVYSNLKEILSHFTTQAEARGDKKARDEFHNPQGLPKPTETSMVEDVNISDELMHIAKGERN